MSVSSLNRSCEETIVDYLIGTIDPLQITASYYTGIGNVDNLQTPAVVVSALDANETYLNSNVWEMIVTVAVKEMAADTASGSLGVLAHEVQNCFWDPDRVDKLNATGSWNFWTYQIQNLNTRHSVSEDALINELQIRVVGTLSGSV